MRVAVIGGGLSGLTAAYRLCTRGVDVELFEGSARVGGLIGSERIDDCVVEIGADSILTEKPAALALARDLGLDEQVIATRRGPRGAYIVHQEKLERIPEGFSLLAPADMTAFARSPLLSVQGKARAALDLVIPAKRDDEDESLESFVVRRFGRELFDRLAQPLAGGIYGADPQKLSLRATMPRFLELERSHGSVIRGLQARVAAQRQHTSFGSEAASGARYGLFAAFRGGMQTLIDGLERALGPHVHKSCLVTAVERDGSGYQIEVRGAYQRYDALIVALPSHTASQVLYRFDRTLADALSEIEYASAATITLCWPRTAIPHALDAFGFVVPVIEGRSIIASTWANVKWEGRAPEDKALIRVFVGGHTGQQLVDYEDDELVHIARRELGSLLGVSAPPSWSVVKRYRRAMPQYHVGHLTRVARIEQLAAAHARFALAGNAYRGVGIPDAVKSGDDAADHILTQAAP